MLVTVLADAEGGEVRFGEPHLWGSQSRFSGI